MAQLTLQTQARSSGAFTSSVVTIPSGLTYFGITFDIPTLTDRTSSGAFMDWKLEIAPTGSTVFKAYATAGGWRGSTHVGRRSTVVNPAPAHVATWPPPGLPGGDARVTVVTRSAIGIGATVEIL